ncbi:UDP-N-acetylmuramoylalanine--D-glutamate ligase [bacterium BMS3Abin04]|nr:UDP-N-acetylmuramoylalanine--D-glutamate ligase [bacterium BMS3Abin04]
MDINRKKISVIGAVRSGIGAAKLIKKMGGIPFVSDIASKEKLGDEISLLINEKIGCEAGGHTERVFDCDLIITSPGVPNDSYVLSEASRRGIKVVSELEFASWFCKGTVVAITGTNGKTTTTSFCSHVLNEAGMKCYSAGNIGNAFSEIALEVKEDEYVSLEVSSFQLDHIEEFKPKISVMLNITPDHLNRYDKSFEKYINSKMNVCKNQDSNDFYIYNADDKRVEVNLPHHSVEKIPFSISKTLSYGAFVKGDKIMFANSNNTRDIVCSKTELSLKGEHNLLNALAVVSIAKTLGVENSELRKGLESFEGVEHRLELVREIDGVKFINDSKATNIDAVWYALRSFDGPILLILGGKDKGNDYNKILELVKNRVKKIYAIGSSAQKIYDFFSDIISVEKVDSLESCVQIAHKDSVPGEVVLLSPACASFDMFDNYEQRGKVFKNEVKKL